MGVLGDRIMMLVCLAFFLGVEVDAQFQLFFGTTPRPRPTTPRPTLPGGYDPACKDALANCDNYGPSSCKGEYVAWAKKNCEATCGFCKPLPTQPPPCVDVLPNCSEYEDSACTDPAFLPWSKQNCRRHCRLCTSNQLANIRTTRPTTVAPIACVDKVDCKLYGRDACSVDIYGQWGRENCAAYCGFCQGIATPPPLCVDKNPDCARFSSDMCTSPIYDLFVGENCLKYCGRC